VVNVLSKSVSRLVSRRVGVDNRTPEIISLAENRAEERIKVAEGHCTKSFLNTLAGQVQGFIWFAPLRRDVPKAFLYQKRDNVSAFLLVGG
jgi:hypothetical protein